MITLILSVIIPQMSPINEIRAARDYELQDNYDFLVGTKLSDEDLETLMSRLFEVMVDNGVAVIKLQGDGIEDPSHEAHLLAEKIGEMTLNHRRILQATVIQGRKSKLNLMGKTAKLVITTTR